MGAAMKDIRIPVAIQKSDINGCYALVGYTNAQTFQGLEPKAVKYLGFFGALNIKTGLYEGDHVFGAATGGEATIDFDALPGMGE